MSDAVSTALRKRLKELKDLIEGAENSWSVRQGGIKNDLTDARNKLLAAQRNVDYLEQRLGALEEEKSEIEEFLNENKE